MNKEELMAEGYKVMAKENLQLAEQFMEMLTIKLPKLTHFEMTDAIWQAHCKNQNELKVIIQAQIDLIKEANKDKNIKWE